MEKSNAKIRELGPAEKLAGQLTTAVESINESVILCDADDRIVFCNRVFRLHNQAIVEYLEPGKQYMSFLRAATEAGLVPDAVGCEAEWLQMRLEQRRNPTGPFVLERQDGLWLLMNEQRLPDGGFMMIATDISELQRAEQKLQKAHDSLERQVEERTRELTAEIAQRKKTADLLAVREKELEDELENRRRIEGELRQLAMTDPLTNIPNRRQFLRFFQYEFKKAKRDRTPFSVLMIDVDYFKRINDAHGHDVGDEVLKYIASKGAKVFRETDVYGRLGGEEFACALPNTSSLNAAHLANRLRKALSSTSVIVAGVDISFTVSIGVAELLATEDGFHAMLKRADDALYVAKNAGRNCVRVSSANADLSPPEVVPVCWTA